MMLLASTIPLIQETRSLSILKKIILFLTYVVLDIYFNCEQGIFYSKFFFTKHLFLQNNNSLVINNSVNTNFVEILKNMLNAHSTFISLLSYTTIPTIFSPSSNIHSIQIIHTTTTTTPTIPTILSRNPFIHITK